MSASQPAIGQVTALTDKINEMVIAYLPSLALALGTLILGLWIIGLITKVVRISMEKSKVDVTLIPFLCSLISWIFKVLLFISVASMVGVATTSFVAVLGAAGLAIGLALQGSLANFAGGVLVMIFKPYKIGDLIEAQGHLGVVKEVLIFNTILVSLQNKRVILPNGVVSNGAIVNYTAEGLIRVDLSVGISYGADIAKSKQVLMEVMSAHDKVLSEPAPFVGVSEMADSSVNLAVRPHCHPDDYWDVFFDINEQMKIALDANDIAIPFPQRDVHLIKE